MERKEELKRKKLKRLRRKIDALDKVLVEVLNQRARISVSIGRLKKQSGTDVLCSDREKQVVNNILSHNGGPISDESLLKIYDSILDESRKIQNELK